MNSSLPNNAPISSQPPTRLFSLKWKALLWNGFILVIGTLLAVGLSYQYLTHQFETKQHTLRDQLQRKADALLEQEFIRLEQIATLLPPMAGIRQFDDILHSGLMQRLDSQWPILALDIGIEAIVFFDEKSQPLNTWQANLNFPSSSQLTALAKSVNQEEDTRTGILCEQTCYEYIAKPIYLEGQRSGVIMIFSHLAQIVLALHEVSGYDIGLLHTEADLSGTTQEIPAWNSQLLALSNRQRNLPILQNSSHQHPLNNLKDGLIVDVWPDSYVELSLLTISEQHNAPSLTLVALDDITEEYQALQSTLMNSLYIALLALAVAEILLLLILWSPMMRLMSIARALPLLAKNQFDEVRRRIILDRKTQSIFPDEIDVLDNTSLELTNRLESLKTNIANKNFELQKKMQQLSAERDFIQSLLNNAQAIIITQDTDGYIQQINQFGCRLLNKSAEELLHTRFEKLLEQQTLPNDFPTRLNELSHTTDTSFQHESLLRKKTSEAPKVITWVHAPLKVTDSKEQPAQILSIGLDITQRKGAEERLAWLDNHDALTGLLNRRRFQQELDAAIRQNLLHNASDDAVILLDIDDFKDLNDTYGHVVGDRLLMNIAYSIKEFCSDTTSLARMSSDEFALILPNTKPLKAKKFAQSLQEFLRHSHFECGLKNCRIRFSMGIALFPQHGHEAETVLGNVDLALSHAKRAGGDRFYLFDELENKDARQELENRVYWKERIQHALEHDGFELFLQPIQHIKRNSISHYEVLLRMQNPRAQADEKAYAEPKEFIPIAETTGLINKIDQRVLEKSIQLLVEIHRYAPEISLSINLSAFTFSDLNLLNRIQDLLTHYQANPDGLIFELTETAAIKDFVSSQQLIKGIRELGCHFALDDFGVGFSSFDYLKKFPVDYLKLDGSFIQNITHNPQDQVLVQALSTIAHGYGKKSIAEFVEDQQTADLLASYGIDLLQGYHFGRPEPASLLLKQLSASNSGK